MDSLNAKDFAFDMLTKLSTFFSTNIERNNDQMTSEMCKIMSRKIKEYIDIANSQLKGEKLNSINEEQENATDLAKNGLNKILDQGIQLAELEDKSISLREHAFMFEDSAKHQKNKYKYQRFKMLMILVGGTFVTRSVLYFLGYSISMKDNNDNNFQKLPDNFNFERDQFQKFADNLNFD